MSVIGEIAASWRDPGLVMRRLMSAGPREDRSLAILMAASVLLFVARLPVLARVAAADPSVPLGARMGGALMSSLFLVPLIAYALALASHMVMRALGREGAAFGARLALFWALLAAAPAALAHGLVSGLAGPAGLVAGGLGALVFALFLWLWVGGLLAAYPGRDRG